MRNQRGDTIVEVLMATVLLSVILAGAYTLSNRATRINQQAFERTQITNYMQAQAEYVRAARDNYRNDPSVWDDIVRTRSKASVPALGAACDDASRFAAGRTETFFIEPNSAPTPPLVVQGNVSVLDELYSVWAEAERGPGNPANPDYIDVHIFGCWEATGDNPNNISALILRLERPR